MESELVYYHLPAVHSISIPVKYFKKSCWGMGIIVGVGEGDKSIEEYVKSNCYSTAYKCTKSGLCIDC